MKIVHVISSLHIGGAEILLVELITSLKERGHEQEVIYFYDGPCKQELIDLGIPLHQIRGMWCRYDPVFWWRLYRRIIGLKPHVLHGSLWAASLGARIIGCLCGIPVISVVHAMPVVEGRMRGIIDRATYWCARELVAVSDPIAAHVQQRAWLSRAHVRTITNGIHFQRLRVRAQRARVTRHDLAYSDEHFIIGAVGRLVPVKNFDFLIDTFALWCQKQPQARLIIIGSGLLEPELRKLIVQHGIDGYVHLISNSRYAHGYYELFDCFVQTSSEGISIALLEAMAFKRACITTYAYRLHAGIINGKNSLVIGNRDQQALLRALDTLQKNPAYREGLGCQAYATIEKSFNFDICYKKYENLFSKWMIKDA